MLLLLFLLLLNTSHILPADPSPLSEKRIKVRFDNTEETAEYPIKYLTYFVTAKDMIVSLGAPSEMPLHNVTKRGFDCLTEFAKAFYENDDDFGKAETRFSNIADQYTDTIDANLLVSADYLGFKFRAFNPTTNNHVTIKMVDKLALLHKAKLKERPFWVTDSDALLPDELKLATPILLLEDLLTIVKPAIKKTSINLEANRYAYAWSPSISGSEHGFGCILCEQKKEQKSTGWFGDIVYGKQEELKTNFSYAYTSLFAKHVLVSKQNIALKRYSD